MNLVLADFSYSRDHLLPLTYMRPVAAIRVGIGSIADKWSWRTGTQVSFLTSDHLKQKFPAVLTADNHFIDGSILPDDSLIKAIRQLGPDEALVDAHGIVAARSGSADRAVWHQLKQIRCADVVRVDRLWKIHQLNGGEIIRDFELLTRDQKSCAIEDPHTIIYNPSMVFAEEGVKIRAAVINADTGPVYLGPNSEIQEGSVIRGPFALGEGSVVAMGTRIRGNVTIGPFCKIGGEINQSVFFGNSNKGHDGYLGNAVVAEYCNLGAGTTASNLKNNFSEARLWSYPAKKFEPVGSLFCGPVLADCSRTAIGTLLNTATSAGVGVNLHGAGFPRTFIPSFASGGAAGFITQPVEDVIDSVAAQLALRGSSFQEADKNILRDVYSQTAEFRTWEH